MDFYQYLMEVENIPYYNFLTELEIERLSEKFDKYIEDCNKRTI